VVANGADQVHRVLAPSMTGSHGWALVFLRYTESIVYEASRAASSMPSCPLVWR
jgi:hypothetical protein